MTTTQSAPTSRPFQASIQARLSRGIGVDQIEEIDYENGGRFTRRVRLVVGPSAGTVDVLDDQQLRQLLTDLHAELAAAPAGVDLVGLEVFTDLIEDALRAEPASNRFDGARFGSVTQDASSNILYGHLSLGIDVVGTVRDLRHELSFEQHVVTMPPGQYRPLSPADRGSLARRLREQAPADPLWQEILDDASRESEGVAVRFVQEHYPDLVAAGGRVVAVFSPAAAELLPKLDVFRFALGSLHPITTKGAARRTIVVDRSECIVVLDLDPTAADAAVASALRGSNLLPPADVNSAAQVATLVDALVPLDPFFGDPTTGGFQATRQPNGAIQAVWSGDRFTYTVDFDGSGAITGLTRQDSRIKPI